MLYCMCMYTVALYCIWITSRDIQYDIYCCVVLVSSVLILILYRSECTIIHGRSNKLYPARYHIRSIILVVLYPGSIYVVSSCRSFSAHRWQSDDWGKHIYPVLYVKTCGYFSLYDTVPAGMIQYTVCRIVVVCVWCVCVWSIMNS